MLYALGALALILFCASILAFVEGDSQADHRKSKEGRIDAHTDEREPHDSSLPTTLAEEKKPPAEGDRAYATRHKRDRFDHVTLIVGLLGLLALIWYASMTAQSVEIARRQFQASERPWVGVNGEPAPKQHPFVNSPDFVMTADVPYTNFGKSPAKQVFFDGMVTAWGVDPRLEFGDLDISGNCSTSVYDRQGVQVAQGKTINPHMPEALLFPQQPAVGLAQGYVRKAELDAAVAGDKGVWIFATGCIDYEDTLGGPHHQTLFCFYWVPRANRMVPCHHGNTARDGDYWKESQKQRERP